MIPSEYKERIKKELEDKMKNSVKIMVFTQEVECQFCAKTRQLVEELAALNDKIEAKIYDFVADSETAKKYGVNMVPAIAILGKKDYGIRFYGIPYGYEFQTLMETIINISRGKTDLSEKVKKKLEEMSVPIHIKVFVTLTCPYCPMVASIANKFAVENDSIRVDVVDVSEFLHLAQKYGVMGVPKKVINERIEFVGAVPEDIFLEHVLLAAHSTVPR